MADDHQGIAIDLGQSAYDGFVITNVAVPVELNEFFADLTDVIEGIGPFRMPG